MPPIEIKEKVRSDDSFILTWLLKGVPEQLLVHALDRVLLHGDGCAKVVLGTFSVVFAHLAPLIFHHDLLELLVGVQDVT